MKIAIIGSRECQNIDLSAFVPKETTQIISGGAKGVDTIAANYAKAHGIELVEFLPNYAQYGRGATFIRNRQIIDNAEYILAFWNGKSKGTKYSIDYARKKNKLIRIIYIL